MDPKINNVTLLILIILGVAVGNLTSSWVTTKYFTKENEKILVELPKNEAEVPLITTEPKIHELTRETVKLSPDVNKELQQDSEIPKNSDDPKLLIEQRKIDENGLRLAKTCNEWTTVHNDMQTQTSERGMNKHCAEYYDYLSFGNLPNSN